jgi:hypothetical protein
LVDGFDEITKVERFGQVVESAQAHGFDRGFDGAVTGDHDDGGFREFLPDGSDQVEAIDVADAKVDDDKVGFLGANGGETFGTGLEAQDGVSGSSAQLAHELQNGGLIVYDYYLSHNSE